MPPLPEEHRQVRAFMDALVAVEQTINDHLPAGASKLQIERGRPRLLPDLPALWNSPPRARQFQRDQANHEEIFELAIYIGVVPGPDAEEMAQYEDYADAARYTLDRAFHRNQPLDNTVTIARRNSLGPALEPFARSGSSDAKEIDVLCVEIPIELHVNRIIAPNTNP